MDKEQIEHRTSVCLRCGKTFVGVPAVSREDNETPICPDCGVREALDSIKVSKEEQDEILRIINRYMNGE
ncbi:MAG: hypothetical protein LUH18_09300 [Oscillospiraceae bacterium]|nr:hypothetical protein [Oscillospiraceae bacterium]